jgi:catechol 2,3-dioxygenase-like lactoylglutathione lyase family enzyme
VIKGFNHVGISVADLDRSSAFYRNVFGMKLVARGQFEGEQYRQILALQGATGNVALLKIANLQIELFEFLFPSPKPGDASRPVCDHGITHFCIEVDDIESEYSRMKNAGVTFHCAPMTFFGTTKATYGRDPDGNVFEMMERCERSCDQVGADEL